MIKLFKVYNEMNLLGSRGGGLHFYYFQSVILHRLIMLLHRFRKTDLGLLSEAANNARADTPRNTLYGFRIISLQLFFWTSFIKKDRYTMSVEFKHCLFQTANLLPQTWLLTCLHAFWFIRFNFQQNITTLTKNK